MIDLPLRQQRRLCIRNSQIKIRIADHGVHSLIHMRVLLALYFDRRGSWEAALHRGCVEHREDAYSTQSAEAREHDVDCIWSRVHRHSVAVGH